jgi:hypothetical protein
MCNTVPVLENKGPFRDKIAPGTIKIVRYSDDREQPKDTIEPSDIAMKPAWVVVHEGL